MNIKSLKYIHGMLQTREADLTEQISEIVEGLVSFEQAQKQGETYNDSAYQELKKRYKAIRKEDELVAQILHDLERHDWR